MIDFDFFIRKVKYSSLIEELIDKLTLIHDRPSLFSHDPKDQEMLAHLYEWDKTDNYSKLSGVTNMGVTNSIEKFTKRY